MTPSRHLAADPDRGRGTQSRQSQRVVATPVGAPQDMAGLLLQLQRTAGNAAVNELLRQYATPVAPPMEGGEAAPDSRQQTTTVPSAMHGRPQLGRVERRVGGALQREVMSVAEFRQAGVSGWHRYGTRKQFRYLTDQLAKLHRTRAGEPRREHYLLKLLALAEQWLNKNFAKKGKEGKQAAVSALKDQVSEELIRNHTEFATDFRPVEGPVGAQVRALVPLLVGIVAEFRAGARTLTEDEQPVMATKCIETLTMFEGGWDAINRAPGARTAPGGTETQKDTLQEVLIEAGSGNCQAGVTSDLRKWVKQLATANGLWSGAYEGKLLAAYTLGEKEKRERQRQQELAEPKFELEPVRWLKWARLEHRVEREEWLGSRDYLIKQHPNLKKELMRVAPPEE